MSKYLGFGLLLMTVAGIANATVGPSVVAAPEIDPATAISGLTMLIGGLAVLRGRRARK